MATGGRRKVLPAADMIARNQIWGPSNADYDMWVGGRITRRHGLGHNGDYVWATGKQLMPLDRRCVLTFTVEAIGANEDDIIVGIVDRDDVYSDDHDSISEQDTLEPTVTSNFASVHQEGAPSYLLLDDGHFLPRLRPRAEKDSVVEIIMNPYEEYCEIQFRIDDKPLYRSDGVIPYHVIEKKNWVPLICLTRKGTILRIKGWREPAANGSDDERWARGLKTVRDEQVALAQDFDAQYGTYNSLRL